MRTPGAVSEVLSAGDWNARAAAHAARLETLLGDYPAWRKAGRKHPVIDFLFTYYSFSMGRLRQWSPGVGVALAGDQPRGFWGDGDHYTRGSQGVALCRDAFPRQRLAGLRWTLGLLERTAARAPFFGCFGLHEWAMVYHADDRRHSTPLRLSQAATDAVVEEQVITCTHFDAFRFFTPDARSLNRLQPTTDDRPEHEQPACLHANMDLYKWSYKLHPWLPSDHLLDCFELALRTRTLDMRASPYDLRDLGYAPIPIETPDGRRDYADGQRAIAEAAAPLRARLIASTHTLLAWLGETGDSSHAPNQDKHDG